MTLRITVAAKLLVLALAVYAYTGCRDEHPGIVPVSGTVTIDGKPLTMGEVRILAANQRPAIGRVKPDGSFTLSCFKLNDGAPTGKHLATVTAVESIDERSRRWHAPKRYANEIDSNLRVTIDGPTDNLKIELTWAGSNQSGPYVEKF
jgi:hypothetical protein